MEEIEMSMYQLDVARELHRDRERLIAETHRAARQAPATSSTPSRTRAVVTVLESLVRLAGHRAHLAH
jgi:hypothetical protein